jgi:hypothetical protein
MLSAISKRYHASIGKSVTSFMVGRREKARCLPALQNDAIGPLRQTMRGNKMSAYGARAEVTGARLKRRE